MCRGSLRNARAGIKGDLDLFWSRSFFRNLRGVRIDSTRSGRKDSAAKSLNPAHNETKEVWC
jgi:hypothetical protein